MGVEGKVGRKVDIPRREEEVKKLWVDVVGSEVSGECDDVIWQTVCLLCRSTQSSYVAVP